MRIGKQDQALTAIATSDAVSITVRGHDLCDDLIGRIDFTDYFWLLVLGERPTEPAAAHDGCLPRRHRRARAGALGAGGADDARRRAGGVAGGDGGGPARHGQRGRGLVRGGRALPRRGAGGGGRRRTSTPPRWRASRRSRPRAARSRASAIRSTPAATRGPTACSRSPTTRASPDRHVDCLRALARHAPGIMDRPLPINVSGAIPAVILDAGWPLEALKAVPLLARTAGLAAHLYEESSGRSASSCPTMRISAIAYDGAETGRALMGILRDVRVIELGTYITGPAAGMHLADLGADVVKVERPGTGDPFRAFKGGLYSPHFQTYNRNKRSIALDTARARGPRGPARPRRLGRRLHPELPPRRRGEARRRRGRRCARSTPA